MPRARSIRRPSSFVASLGLIATLVTGGSAWAVSTPAAESPPIGDAEVRAIALGVSIFNGREIADLDAFRSSIGGLAPATWTIWSQWGSQVTQDFPTSIARAAEARGSTPMIWWEPVDPANLESPTYARLANITAGMHDAYIREYARAARAFEGPVILRFAHEPNGGTFPWGRTGFDNTATSFVEAWRHVHRIFQEEVADNVRFLWSVGKQGCPGRCNAYTAWYPGDAYVDYLGFSSFNWGAQQDEWIPMLKGFRRVTELLGEISSKPIIAVESASNPDGGDKAAWIRDGYRAVHEALPEIVGIVYLNVDLRSSGHPDWRLSSPPAALAAYADIAAMPEFQGRLPAET